MRQICLSLLLFIGLPVLANGLSLLPMPRQIQLQTGQLDIRYGIKLSLPDNDPLLRQAGARFLQRLQDMSEYRLSEIKEQRVPLTVSVSMLVPDSDAILGPAMREDYQLQITVKGISLHASSRIGVLRGFETLLQLVQTADGQQLPLLEINDAPRFSWRGLLLDPARRFLPIAAIERQLDMMAKLKLNVLHLHLTDDQGWRFESKHFPKLQQIGGQDGYYTQAQLRQLVGYAAQRGIRIVPEIDLPGHTTALGAAYPELMTQPGPAEPERHWGVHPAVMDISDPDIYPFIQTLLKEVSAVFPDPYIHIGGDEVMADHWLTSAKVNAFMQAQGLADAQALHDHFNQKLQQILASLNRKMIGWDEILHSQLPKSVLVQSWRGRESLQQAADEGYQAILSTGYYLDQPQFASYHYRNDPLLAPAVTPELETYAAVSAWQFSFARKRGSAVSGRLVVLQNAKQQMAGLIIFDNRRPIEVQQLHLDANRLQFQFDSWMGPVSADLNLDASLQGTFVVGNAPYKVQGSPLTLTAQQGLAPGLSDTEVRHLIQSVATSLSGEAKAKVLGGEITLWGELITPDNIDIRLWPNGFAVAERLWSAPGVTDETAFYHRLDALSSTLAPQVAVMQRKGYQQLVGTAAPQLELITQVLEPAHYYHRLHEKSAAKLYHRDAPLNQLVDYLSAEQPALRHFSNSVKTLQLNDTTALAALLSQLALWQQAAKALTGNLDKQHELQPLVLQVLNLCQSAQLIVQHMQQAKPLTDMQRQAIQQQINQAEVIQNELIMALHRPLQQLLNKLPDSEIWQRAGTFSAAAEGPAVDSEGNLYAVNFSHDGTIGKISGSGEAELLLTLPKGSTANGIVFDSGGAMYMADYTAHQVLKYKQGQLSVHSHNKAMHQPNDLAIMSDGTLFASDPDWANSKGQLWRVNPDGTSVLLADDMGTTNGIAVSPDQQFLYVNESVQRRIWRFRIGADNNLSDKQLFARFNQFGLDGMRTDKAGNLYVARYGKGVIAKLSPDGRLLREYRLHNPYPTNVALNQDQTLLYVTIQQCGCIERIVL